VRGALRRTFVGGVVRARARARVGSRDGGHRFVTPVTVARAFDVDSTDARL